MQIIGHRGARNEAPENTQAGFEYLRQLGLHHVELDIRLSSDDQLVVIHDTSVNRTCNGRGRVRELTASAMQALDATKPFSQWPQPSGVPLLCDVLEQWPALQSIQLEVKTTDLPSLKIIVRKLVTLIEQFNLHDQATITTTDQKLLQLLHRSEPHIARGLVAERFIRSPIDVCLRHQCTLIAANYHRCSERFVATAHQAGLQVSCWTVNSVNVARRLQSIGVDSLITDCPTTLLQQLSGCDV
ncbi:glycerophosphodiester phosphodiesterase [Ketobacter sp. MCCC 1A13808]|uniref:glycerophosphodiester phosphodiesterase n=1 Tax=Ketobacter sp. MCCC 1A13808 TaxID=2602738 RepID=UPI0012EBAECE|nr:glycerophosphodiester phosphodiesterase [Ketobacter sp. MCCC 1A13808]MVF10711.1 glycerophosphodiester phosphodiesterase [Ketobacter sp. MCCC 1A13808]